MDKKIKKSFKEWCIENKHEDFLDLWDYELNNKLPSEIPYGTTKKYYFKCPRNLHKSELKNINTITNYKRIPECIECRSFNQWCYDNDRHDLLDRWDYELNSKLPNEEFYGTLKKYYFKCPRGLHESELIRLNDITNKNTTFDIEAGCKRCRSFYRWCIDNDKQCYLDRWDYINNNVSPQDVYYGTSKKYYFKCPLGIHESKEISLNSITNKLTYQMICIECNSFGQWCLNNNRQDLLKLWDYDLNKESPFKIQIRTDKKIWFKCPVSKHESHKKSIIHITKDNIYPQCPKCNSFAQWGIDNLGDDFLEKYWDYEKNININPWSVSKSINKKVWIYCQEKDYHGSYEITCGHFTAGIRCSYCKGRKTNYYDSLGYLYPEVLEIWSDKNKKSPYEYAPHAGKKIWLKCFDGIHEDYKRIIRDIIRYEFRCPECVRERTESFLQEKIRTYINNAYNYELLHENKCRIIPINPKTKYLLPFDNEVIQLKLIIETHGIQHYRICTWHKQLAKLKNTTPEYELYYQKLKDRYKRFIAHHQNYFYLEIPYWTEDDESYKKLIDDKIQEILNIKNRKVG